METFMEKEMYIMALDEEEKSKKIYKLSALHSFLFLPLFNKRQTKKWINK